MANIDTKDNICTLLGIDPNQVYYWNGPHGRKPIHYNPAGGYFRYICGEQLSLEDLYALFRNPDLEVVKAQA